VQIAGCCRRTASSTMFGSNHVPSLPFNTPTKLHSLTLSLSLSILLVVGTTAASGPAKKGVISRKTLQRSTGTHLALHSQNITMTISLYSLSDLKFIRGSAMGLFSVLFDLTLSFTEKLSLFSRLATHDSHDTPLNGGTEILIKIFGRHNNNMISLCV
jgi:hypothetical protein